jgi:hypothetical protein
MKTETIEKFYIETEVAEHMAGIYNAYIKQGEVTLEDCQYSLLSSMAMLDLNDGLDDTLNREWDNDGYYLARAIVRLPFDSGREEFSGNRLSDTVRGRLSVAEFLR